jgi:hypothetical protein
MCGNGLKSAPVLVQYVDAKVLQACTQHQIELITVARWSLLAASGNGHFSFFSDAAC